MIPEGAVAACEDSGEDDALVAFETGNQPAVQLAAILRDRAWPRPTTNVDEIMARI